MGIVMPMAPAHAQATRDYAIPAGDLAEAINSFAEQSGVQLLYDAALTRGRRTAGLNGRFGTAAGLSRLLAGSGLTFRQKGPNIFTLEAAPQASGNAVHLGSVRVEGSVLGTRPPQPEVGTLSPVYAGGQVARGGKLGMLGDRDMMDQPFNQTSYTKELIQDQQVRLIGEVLENDPSAQTTNSTTGHDAINIRGFHNGNGFILFNGLQGIVTGTLSSVPAESFERVEVLKGPNVLLNGNVGKVGGVINMTPKRAGDAPLTQATIDYMSDSQIGGHVDIGRRFGGEQQFGIRFNGVYRDGDTAVDRQSRRTALGAVGLDYRGERLRLDADLGAQELDLQGMRRISRPVTGVTVPRAPDSSTNWFDPAEYVHTELYYGAARGEFDLLDQLTVFAAVGGSDLRYQRLMSGRNITNLNGDLAAGSIEDTVGQRIQSTTAEAGLRGTFDTGVVHHQVTLSAMSALRREGRTIAAGSTPFPASNVYNPVFGASPTPPRVDFGTARKRVRDHYSSIAIADTISALDDRVQLTVGARLQKVEVTNFNQNSGAISSAYDEDAVTPMVGVVVKPVERLSVYANYIQALQAGASAPTTAANAGEVLPPYKTAQYELGAKRDFGTLTATVAVYQITQPSAYTNPNTNRFDADGEQRHRGVDFNLFGEVVKGFRVLGGVAYIDSELRNTLRGANDGNQGIGVSKWRLVMGAGWDAPFVPGLTLTARGVHNDAAYLDPANRQRVPAWNRLDLGARYRLTERVMLRANVENAFDGDYWTTAGDSEIILSAPRSFRLSATIDF